MSSNIKMFKSGDKVDLGITCPKCKVPRHINFIPKIGMHLSCSECGRTFNVVDVDFVTGELSLDWLL